MCASAFAAQIAEALAVEAMPPPPQQAPPVLQELPPLSSQVEPPPLAPPPLEPRAHPVAGPFACAHQGCTKRYKRSTGLERHQGAKHGGLVVACITIEEPSDTDADCSFPCTQRGCFKRFKRCATLTKHEEIDHGTVPVPAKTRRNAPSRERTPMPMHALNFALCRGIGARGNLDHTRTGVWRPS